MARSMLRGASARPDARCQYSACAASGPSRTVSGMSAASVVHEVCRDSESNSLSLCSSNHPHGSDDSLPDDENPHVRRGCAGRSSPSSPPSSCDSADGPASAGLALPPESESESSASASAPPPGRRPRGDAAARRAAEDRALPSLGAVPVLPPRSSHRAVSLESESAAPSSAGARAGRGGVLVPEARLEASICSSPSTICASVLRSSFDGLTQLSVCRHSPLIVMAMRMSPEDEYGSSGSRADAPDGRGWDWSAPIAGACGSCFDLAVRGGLGVRGRVLCGTYGVVSWLLKYCCWLDGW